MPCPSIHVVSWLLWQQYGGSGMHAWLLTSSFPLCMSSARQCVTTVARRPEPVATVVLLFTCSCIMSSAAALQRVLL